MVSPIYFTTAPIQLLVERTTVSSRIPGTLNASLQRAAESTGAFRSELIRRAIRYYLKENPDDLGVLRNSTESTAPLNQQGFPINTVDLRRANKEENEEPNH